MGYGYAIGKLGRLNRISKNGKFLLLAMDQGIEHGPKDFNDKNIDPDWVIQWAVKGNFTGMILQKGVALKYWENYSGKVPLILKLNGKTDILPREEAYSAPLATVKDAVALGADAIGYTIYVGSQYEAQMFHDFSLIEAEARDYGIPTIIWAYPRGTMPKEEEKTLKYVGYAARVALELGADVVKVNYTGSKETFKEVVKYAQKTRVISAGGSTKSDEEFFAMAKDIMDAGACGFAIGRNVWQRDDPMPFIKRLRKIVWPEED
ncbi:MAG: class I fructose-bisphosphate aldolase [Candidatus Micrarchaeota archaeon]|nr:class I fructose-bisphosphate aldolase [Candidatus Micrarchaeota archaeon]